MPRDERLPRSPVAPDANFESFFWWPCKGAFYGGREAPRQLWLNWWRSGRLRRRMRRSGGRAAKALIEPALPRPGRPTANASTLSPRVMIVHVLVTQRKAEQPLRNQLLLLHRVRSRHLRSPAASGRAAGRPEQQRCAAIGAELGCFRTMSKGVSFRASVRLLARNAQVWPPGFVRWSIVERCRASPWRCGIRRSPSNPASPGGAACSSAVCSRDGKQAGGYRAARFGAPFHECNGARQAL